MNYLVVGGSTGVGKAITEILSSQGHKVFVASRNAEDRMPSAGNITVHNLDVNEDINLDCLPDELNGIAYCPGTINLKPFHRLKQEDFQNDLDINLLGAVKVLQAAMPKLKNAGNASVVLFSSVAAQKGLMFHASISAAKGAIEGLTKALSAEWAPTIRVNTLALALTETPMAERLLNSDSKKQASNERHPLKRFGQPEDSAQLATFLLSEKSSWITGQIIGVDGGMSSIQNL